MKKTTVEFKTDKSRDDIRIEITASELDPQVSALIDELQDPLPRRITVHDSDSSELAISTSDILSISTDNHRLSIITPDGDYELRMTLRDIERILDPKSFLRISRYEIINLDRVRRFDFSISGSLQIEMENGMTTWASRRHISEIKKRFTEKTEVR